MPGFNHRVSRLEQAMGEPGGLTAGQRAIVQWLGIWRLTPQKRAYLQRVGREDLIDLAEPLQDILEDPAAFLAEFEGQGFTTLEIFLHHLYSQAHR